MDERPLDDELGEFLKALQRRWYIVLGAILQFAVLAYLLTSLQTPVYRAETTVLLEPSAAQQTIDPGSANNTGSRGRNIGNEIILATSGEVMVELAQAIGETNVDALRRSLTVTGDPDSDILTFFARDTDAQVAASTVNTWAEIYISRQQAVEANSLQGAIDLLEVRLADLQAEQDELLRPLNALRQDRANELDLDNQGRLDALVLAEQERIATESDINSSRIQTAAANLINLGIASDIASTGTARIVSVAEVPKEAFNIAPARNLAIGIILGGIIGLILVRFLSRQDDRISSANEIEVDLRLPVLASIPTAPRSLRRNSELALVAAEHPNELISEAFNQLRTSISYLQNDDRRTAVLVTSASQGEGKTTTASNIALTSALAGTKTTLIDLDLRRPRSHEAFSLSLRPGFSDIVNGDSKAEYATHQFQDLPFSLITAGTPTRNPASLVAGEKAVDFLDDTLMTNDMVVLDTPPLLAVSDAASIAASIDAACVIVVRARSTTKADVRETVKRMERAGAQVIGVILTEVKASKASGRHYYGVSEDGPRSESSKLVVVRKSPETRRQDAQVGGAPLGRSSARPVPVPDSGTAPLGAPAARVLERGDGPSPTQPGRNGSESKAPPAGKPRREAPKSKPGAKTTPTRSGAKAPLYRNSRSRPSTESGTRPTSPPAASSFSSTGSKNETSTGSDEQTTSGSRNAGENASPSKAPDNKSSDNEHAGARPARRSENGSEAKTRQPTRKDAADTPEGSGAKPNKRPKSTGTSKRPASGATKRAGARPSTGKNSDRSQDRGPKRATTAASGDDAVNGPNTQPARKDAAPKTGAAKSTSATNKATGADADVEKPAKPATNGSKPSNAPSGETKPPNRPTRSTKGAARPPRSA